MMHILRNSICWKTLFLIAFIFLYIPATTFAQDYELEQLQEGFHEEAVDEEEFEGTVTPNVGVPLPSEALKESSSKAQTEEPLDENEFEGVSESKQDIPSSTPTAPIETNLPPLKRTYYVEAIYIVALILYAINYIIGRRQNDAIAKAWALTFRELFESQFSKVGDNAVLSKISQYHYRMKCTGRVNCVGLQAELKLPKRQDLFSRIASFIVSTPDKLIIEIPLLPEHMEPFVFAVVKKKEEKHFRKENADISAFAEVVPSPLPPEFSVLTDTEELVDVFLHDHVLATIPKYADRFVFLHFTDQSASVNYKRLLRFEFLLPTNTREMERLSTLLRMSLHFIDLVARTTLSPAAKARNEKRRAKATEAALKMTHQQRQEELQKRKQEQRQKELEQIRNLSPEAQQKKEEKLQKKAMKKKMAGRYKVVYG